MSRHKIGPPPPEQQCTAPGRRSGTRCKCWAIKGKTKCRYHGGASTGPKTAAGKDKVAAAATTHGQYTLVTRKEELRARLVIALQVHWYRHTAIDHLDWAMRDMTTRVFDALQPDFRRFIKGQIGMRQLDWIITKTKEGKRHDRAGDSSSEDQGLRDLGQGGQELVPHGTGSNDEPDRSSADEAGAE